MDELIAGVDEVGKGAFYGPVVSAAVMFPQSLESAFWKLGVRDSKKLSEKEREEIYPQLLKLVSDVRISWVDARRINKIGIEAATILTMKSALCALEKCPSRIVIDGKKRVDFRNIPQEVFPKADSTIAQVIAASLVAKVWRDRRIRNMAKNHPGYDLDNNKGYGTRTHRDAIRKMGITKEHRTWFCRAQIRDYYGQFKEEIKNYYESLSQEEITRLIRRAERRARNPELYLDDPL